MKSTNHLTAVVTGGTTRIGLAVAGRLRAGGWQVLTSSHRTDAGADIVADLSEPAGAARLYAEGVVPGVSDLIYLEPRGGYGALCIEMKTTLTGSRQSDRQKEWQKAVEAVGIRYVICRTLEEFMKEVEDYLALEPMVPAIGEVEF